MSQLGLTYLKEHEQLLHKHAVSHSRVLGEAVEQPAHWVRREEAHRGASQALQHLLVQTAPSSEEGVGNEDAGRPSSQKHDWHEVEQASLPVRKGLLGEGSRHPISHEDSEENQQNGRARHERQKE